MAAHGMSGSNPRLTLVSELVDEWKDVEGDWHLEDYCGCWIDFVLRDPAGNLSTVFDSLLERENGWFLFHRHGEVKRLPTNITNSSSYDIKFRVVSGL